MIAPLKKTTGKNQASPGFDAKKSVGMMINEPRHKRLYVMRRPSISATSAAMMVPTMAPTEDQIRVSERTVDRDADRLSRRVSSAQVGAC